MEKQIKLYLDTSVWNFALEIERSSSSLTREFLELLQLEEYIAITSDVVEVEILAAPEPRKSKLKSLIGSVNNLETVVSDKTSKKLASIYVNEGLNAYSGPK